ncbi:SufS family cysteine desulfurase [Candidatus Karelsulcia muelleri]|uniref:Probable cysteine desulfurase n=1 Tax=Candidatus Karelsulcia muelleri TaxID=336810 RepID=A0A346E127_9FLAO|nr:SufS family cysteine desulfurase [Candidatus Karelsulcia muelleri]AXN02682.1 Cysteine desulfurase, SufS subfamily [Candidatus Karelsulcia muelleri]WDI79612.1 SufS family cysteine desulfurase [Candidatus Karelsulcia muelleri]WDR78934.1 SufS family cysteine desulfurase [Candidatus Karelsulcia muelleri]
MFSYEEIKQIRNQFPILKTNETNSIYFDNAATTQKPVQVINTIKKYYCNFNSNVNRSVHFLDNFTNNYLELSRKQLKYFINAKYREEIIFTTGTTESINLIAFCISKFIKKSDDIIISHSEHHSNIIPWQVLSQNNKANLKVIPVNSEGELNIRVFKKLMTKKTKLISISHVTNTFGILNPINKILKTAQKHNSLVLIDGSQAISHITIDVQNLACDFYVFSIHKMYGPTGLGILYGKKKVLDKFPPYKCGGGMIEKVNFKKTRFSGLPFKLEAGTPNIAGIIGTNKALQLIVNYSIIKINSYETKLLKYAIKILSNINGMKIYYKNSKLTKILSFNIENIHSFDLGKLLNNYGIAVRTGTHCAQPIMEYLKINGTIRISFAMYNTIEEIDIFYKYLIKCLDILR